MQIIRPIFLIFVIVFLTYSSALPQSITVLDRADVEFKSRNYYEAASLYRRAIRRVSDDELNRVYFQLGECYRNVNNFGQARQWYLKAIEEGYAAPIVHFHMGNMLLVSGDYRTAKTYFERYLQSNPENRELVKNRIASCDFGVSLETQRPFHEIQNARELNTAYSDYSITFIHDHKVVISSMRMEDAVGTRIDPRTMQGFSNLFESEYNISRERWSTPSPLKGEINSSFNEGTFAYDPHTQTGYLMQCRGERRMEGCGIYTSRYNSSNNTWSKPELLNLVYGDYTVGHPTLSNDGRTLIFVSDMPGGYGGTDLWMSKYDGFGWGQPVNLGPKVNSAGNEMFPYFFNDETLYFASDGHIGLGGLDIYSSTYENGTFGSPKNLEPPFNSSADDFGFVYRDDSKYDGFFISNRPGGQGDDDIYYFSLLPVIITLSDKVIDSETGTPIRNAMVYLQGDDDTVDSTQTDRRGIFSFSDLNPNTTYRLYVPKDGYLGDSKYKVVGNEKYSIDLSLGEPFALIKITKEEIEIRNIYYDYAKWNLRDESKRELDRLVNLLKENPEIEILINSHTDIRGRASYNQELSEKRAQSVVDYLTSNGISRHRLQSKGWGATRLIVPNAETEDEHQRNRRTTFNILNVEDISSRFVVKTFEPIEPVIKEGKTPIASGFAPVTPDSINEAINSFFEGEGSYSVEDILEMINKLFE